MHIGEIRLFAGNYAPQGWALCDGSLVESARNPELFQKIGTKYGGTAQSFALPDLRGRAPMHAGNGVALGSKGTIDVDAGEERRYPGRVALNFIIGLSDPDGWLKDYEPLVGEVRLFAIPFTPRGWHACDGGLASLRERNILALFAVIGDSFGGDAGRQILAFPNLSPRYPFQPADPADRGQAGGAQPYREGNVTEKPLLALNYCIAVEGVFPSRS